MKCVMQQAITYRCLMNTPRLWIVDWEMLIRTVSIPSIRQIVMQINNLIREIQRKYLYIFLVSLPVDKLRPRFYQVIERDEFLE